MKRRHEELTRNEFDSWLRTCFPNLSIQWTEPASEEPRPDWYLTIADRLYAVEATSIVPTPTQGGNRVLEPSISAPIDEFVDDLEREARAQGILNGAYVLSICPLPLISGVRTWLPSQVFEYLRETFNDAVAPARSLGFVKRHEITIEKIRLGQSYLAEVISFEGWSSDEVGKDLTTQLRTALEEKATHLADLPHPVILLLLDGFHIADKEDWLRASVGSVHIVKFDAVFRIKPVNPPHLLYSRSPFWSFPGPGVQLAA